jgi:hypothetical protein
MSVPEEDLHPLLVEVDYDSDGAPTGVSRGFGCTLHIALTDPRWRGHIIAAPEASGVDHCRRRQVPGDKNVRTRTK